MAGVGTALGLKVASTGVTPSGSVGVGDGVDGMSEGVGAGLLGGRGVAMGVISSGGSGVGSTSAETFGVGRGAGVGEAD